MEVMQKIINWWIGVVPKIDTYEVENRKKEYEVEKMFRQLYEEYPKMDKELARRVYNALFS